MPARNEQPEDLFASMARSDKGQFRSYAKQLEIIKRQYSKVHEQAQKAVGSNKSLQAALKAQKKVTADLNKTSRTQISALKGQAKFAKQAVAAYKASEATMRRTLKTQERMFRQERKLMRQRERIARMSRRGGGGAGFGGLGIGSIAGLGVAYAGLRKIQTLVERQLQGALVGGVGGVQALRGSLPAGVVPSRALGLLAGVQGASPTLRFATQGVPQATAKLAEAVKGLGDVGSDLVTQFVGTLEPAAQRAFVQAVNARGVRAAVQQYASGQNIGLATSLLNAGDIAGGKTGDPLIDAAVKTQSAFDALNASIEQVIAALADKLAPAIERIAGMVEAAPMTALGIGGAAMLAGSGLGRAGLSAGGRALLPLVANPIGAAVAIGTAGAFAIDHAMHDKSLAAEFAAVDEATAVAMKQNKRFAEIAELNKGTLRGRKQAAEARLGQFELTHQRSATAQFFGYNEFSDEDAKTIDRMRAEIAALSREYNKASNAARRAAEQAEAVAKSEAKLTEEREANERITKLQQQAARRAELMPQVEVAGARAGLAREMINAAFLAPFRDMQVPLTDEQRAYQATLLTQIAKLEQVLTTIDTNTDKGQAEAAGVRTEINRLRNEQARQAQFAYQLQMADYADKLNILRLQYQVASTTPLGIIGSLDKLEDLQRGLTQEISRIRERITELREKGSEEALREARKLEQQVLSLELELRQLRLQAMTALLDATVAQAFSAGAFEKILITQNQNLGMALEKELIKVNPYITGLSGQAAIEHDARPISQQEMYRRQQAQESGTSSAISGALAPLSNAVANVKDLTEIGEAKLKILRAQKDLTVKEIALLEALEGKQSEGVDYSTHPAIAGGNAVPSG